MFKTESCGVLACSSPAPWAQLRSRLTAHSAVPEEHSAAGSFQSLAPRQESLLDLSCGSLSFHMRALPLFDFTHVRPGRKASPVGPLWDVLTLKPYEPERQTTD